ncbi:MAG TPA: DUF3048 domain-containing protein [Firmicutes bacterium]|nr:DUF3048 domain-containing protein [Bacillota bacterium]
MVYEAVAEGGITRFLAVFHRHAAAKIGPVRSARIYFVEIAKAYAAPLAHCGDNADALEMIRKDRSFPDMDEIYTTPALISGALVTAGPPTTSTPAPTPSSRAPGPRDSHSAHHPPCPRARPRVATRLPL